MNKIIASGPKPYNELTDEEKKKVKFYMMGNGNKIEVSHEFLEKKFNIKEEQNEQNV